MEELLVGVADKGGVAVVAVAALYFYNKSSQAVAIELRGLNEKLGRLLDSNNRNRPA